MAARSFDNTLPGLLSFLLMKVSLPASWSFASLVNIALVAVLVVSGLLLVRDAVTYALRGAGPGALPEEKSGYKVQRQKARTLQTYAPILSNNVFGFPGGTLSPITLEGKSSAPTVALNLLGTVAWPDGFGYAIISADDGRQEVYRAGQYLKGGGILKKVYKDKVLVESGGRSVEVKLAELASVEEVTGGSRKAGAASKDDKGRQAAGPGSFARQTSEGSFMVDRSAVQAALADPKQIMTDARLLPNMVEGRQEGFVIREIRPNGVYQSLGLRNGDVLLRVNEFDISDPETALQVFTALRGMDKVELDIVRGGSRMTLTYMIR
jgi:general secretion pathway protein C